MRKSTGLIPILLLVLSASLASAQQPSQLQLDRSFISITQLAFPHASYEFAGPNVLISGYIPDGDGLAQPNCSPCIGGDQAAVNGYFNSEKPVTMIVDGISRDIYVHSELFLTGATITIPNRLGVMFGTITVPATMTGTLTGYPRNPNSTPGPTVPIFINPLNFQGTVTVFTRSYVDFTGLSVHTVRQIAYNLTAVHEEVKQ